MVRDLAPGLPADWINAWLAAVGVTVLLPTVRLGWSQARIPVALFEHSHEGGLAGALANALPEPGALADLFPGAALGRRARIDQFSAAAARARALRDPSLAIALTDLARPDPALDTVGASAFYASGPGTIGPLLERVRRCRERLEADPEGAIDLSLRGVGSRTDVNGLGFDYRRIAIGDLDGRAGGIFVDPVVETLAFFGLAMFPVRGDGRRQRTRGWVPPKQKGQAESLRWPAWAQCIDRWAVDALLGVVFAARDAPAWTRLGVGVFAAFETVTYQSKGTADPTRGFGSRRIL